MTAIPWHALESNEVVKRIGAHVGGLSVGEASERLLRFGRNEIARRKPASPVWLFFKQFASFFVLILLFAATLAFAVSFLPGESGLRRTAFFILGIIALSVALGFYKVAGLAPRFAFMLPSRNKPDGNMLREDLATKDN